MATLKPINFDVNVDTTNLKQALQEVSAAVDVLNDKLKALHVVNLEPTFSLKPEASERAVEAAWEIQCYDRMTAANKPTPPSYRAADIQASDF